jgi:hypothetical protein
VGSSGTSRMISSWKELIIPDDCLLERQLRRGADPNGCRAEECAGAEDGRGDELTDSLLAGRMRASMMRAKELVAQCGRALRTKQ